MILVQIPTFRNTKVFREEGLRFLEYGEYTKAVKNTKAWYDYWREQKRRCIEGYTVNGISITGYHYFYLNFAPMVRAKDPDDPEAQSAEEIESFPDFYDYDWIFFNNVQRALKEGKHMVVLKARRKGYSYKVGAMLARNFLLKKRSRNYAMAFESEFLIKDGLLSKCWDDVNFNDASTAFGQPRLIDQQLHKRSGYKRNVNGADVEMGLKSEIIGISMKDNPDKARGKAGELGVYEEAGRFPNLTTTWEINMRSYERGMYTTGLMIAFGTGGAEDADFESLELMFRDPATYNVLVFNNIWDDGALGNPCGFFVPAYVNFEGAIDEQGNSDEEKAKAFLKKQRDIRKNAKDIDAYAQYCRELPFTPTEALMSGGKNVFPVAELQDHLGRVEAQNLDRQVVNGFLVETQEGIKFQISVDAKPVTKFPLPEKTDHDGCISILEGPVRVNGVVPDNRYIAVHDPYAIDQTDKKGPRMSLGATYIIKLPNVQDATLNGCIVAWYVGRPKFRDEYTRNMFNLVKYYNAKLGYEANRGTHVKDYAVKHTMLDRLFANLDIIDKRRRTRRSATTITYGITINEDLKYNAQLYLRDWLQTVVKIDHEGTEKLRLHYILDTALLKELIKFNPDGNFDRVSAMLVGMFYFEEAKTKAANQPSTERVQQFNEFFLNRASLFQ